MSLITLSAKKSPKCVKFIHSFIHSFIKWRQGVTYFSTPKCEWKCAEMIKRWWVSSLWVLKKAQNVNEMCKSFIHWFIKWQQGVACFSRPKCEWKCAEMINRWWVSSLCVLKKGPKCEWNVQNSFIHSFIKWRQGVACFSMPKCERNVSIFSETCRIIIRWRRRRETT
jgi:hypothetical protein